MPKTKDGETITWKQFFRRWKRGIEGVTPFQQARMTFHSTWIILVGIVLGFEFSLFRLASLYWLSVILIGALANTIIIQIGNYQKYKLLRRLEDEFN